MGAAPAIEIKSTNECYTNRHDRRLRWWLAGLGACQAVATTVPLGHAAIEVQP